MRLHKRFFVPFEIFLISLDLIRYQKIKIIYKEMLIMKGKGNTCEYCSGQGYFQLLLGGSETCNGCEGSGKAGEKS